MSTGLGSSGRPLVISDCDEVLLHMVAPFRDWLGEVHGIDFSMKDNDFGKALTYSNKIIFSVLSWLVFGALLYGRKRYGWRGRTALNWIMACSVLLLLAYVGSKLLPDTLFGV